MPFLKKNEHELIIDAQNTLDKVKDLAAKDPTRPLYHGICPANWMNDPNGPILVNNKYHIFYQHHPYSPTWGPMYWGHMTSDDLIHWNHEPIALAPSDHKGESGCWSGTCVIGPNNRPAILYTSVGKNHDPKLNAEQWLAWGSPDLISWEKYHSNPVMTIEMHSEKLPSNCHIEEWRDPYTWKGDDGAYYTVCGGHIECPHAEKKYQRNPTVFLYRSSDLVHWEFLNPLFSRFNNNEDSLIDEQVNLGDNWECPNFFPLDNKWVLVVSNSPPIAYCIGEFQNNHFIPTRWHFLDHSRTFYAPNSFKDKIGRQILIGWVRECKGEHWQGCFSLPRWVSIHSDNTLLLRPIPELFQLRKDQFHQDNLQIQNNESLSLQNLIESSCIQEMVKNRTIELEFNISRNDLKQSGFMLEFYDEQKFGIQACLTWDAESQRLFLGGEGGSFQWDPSDKILNLDIWIDRSVIEIFINQKWAITQTYHLSEKDGLKLQIRAEDKTLILNTIDIWGLSF